MLLKKSKIDYGPVKGFLKIVKDHDIVCETEIIQLLQLFGN
jgi:hypothetical protein